MRNAEHYGGGNEKEKTPEEILEGEIKYGFAEDPMSPDEIERRIRHVKERGINPDVPPVIRKILKERVCGHGDFREIESLLIFCEQQGIFFDAKELDEIEHEIRQKFGGGDSARLTDLLQAINIAKLKKHFKGDKK